MICGWTFGAVLIVFFLTSSKVRCSATAAHVRCIGPDPVFVLQLTRLKQERKAELDESFKLEGQRGLKQVSLADSVLLVMHRCTNRFQV